jgi:tetratricopeptide (TPR) repeat protein
MPAMNPRTPISLLAFAVCVSAAASPVRVWQTNLVLPTYLAAPPSPVPRFYEGRTYQGAKATFYPYPVQDVLTDVKSNVTYRALFLENDYLQISVLPELGGRIWSATDKANGYDFFYRQHVVKPALIGMLGAWISGGVEWNVPHHHRASSFLPVDCTTATNADGSATIWVGEIELRHRMKWLVGMTLYPDRSYLELTCKVFNRTPFAHPMLFWINPAVHANEHYQVLFPPGTEWATQHGKPEFASWPIARQVYGGTDYTRGVDISWWKNHPTPVSFFAWNYEDDWFGGYDHGRQAGVLHVADRHVVPGKKFFEWGNGPEGEMWTKILTDEDGPYLELMAGAWSDNQPDYSWIQPGEMREWQHWWYPIRNLGGVKAATRDAAVNLEVTNRVAKVAVNATREVKGAKVRLEMRSAGASPTAPSVSALEEPTGAGAGREHAGRVRSPTTTLLDQPAELSPATPFAATITLENDVPPENLRLSVLDAGGRELVAYQPQPPRNTPLPKPVERPKPPKEYASTDELYFTGQRIEQLYSPSFEAQPYYEEILRRDPGDYRANTALGILLSKQWRWDEAAKHLSNAVARATANYIRPKDGEAFYYLGVALKAQGMLEDAEEAFQKAVWSPAWQAAGGCELVELDLQRGRLGQALPHADLALTAAGNNARARNQKATILRKLGQPEAAERLATDTLAADPLNVRAALEQVLAQRQRGAPEWRENVARVRRLMGRNPEAFVENAIAFASAGQWPEVVEIMRDQVAAAASGDAETVATALYLLAYALERTGQTDAAAEQFAAAARTSPAFCFPSRFEEEPILRHALERNPQDANAAYLLGCLLYDHQPENAIKAWEEARRRDERFALTHRNLALAYAQHQKDISKAIASLERAVELDPAEPRFFYELDVLYEAGGTPVAKRLAMLTKHHDTVAKRDDALMREIVLLTVAGQPARALELLRSRRFRNWEGSSQIHHVYVDACLARGRQLLAGKQPRATLREFEAALEYPENLEVGRARRAPRAAQIQYFIGTAHEAQGDAAAAIQAFELAAAGRGGGGSEADYFRALALQKLGRAAEAKPVFESLVKAGEEQLARGEAPDYFAKFGERQSERVRQANAHYLIGLGRLGLGETAQAEAAFKQARELHPAHLGASQR